MATEEDIKTWQVGNMNTQMGMNRKGFTVDQMNDKYYKLTKSKRIEVLENALGLMESANSQDYWDVIYKSMGYELEDGLWVKERANSRRPLV